MRARAQISSRRLPAALACLVWLSTAACGSSANGGHSGADAADGADASDGADVTATATVTGDGDGDGDGGTTERIRNIKVLYTNDEHGWMEGQDPGRAAANLVSVWRDVEGYDPGGDFVVLSGGDMWTGPAVSTWFEGESMVEVMNEMGYDAAALGNHEFDFGLDVLAERAAESAFPFLSANTREKGDGAVPDQYGFSPYHVVDLDGVRIGVIGLTTRSTPTTTLPANVESFDFIDYEQALREYVPQVRAEGVDLIFVPGHVCMYELEPLAQEIGDLDIDLLGGGHCNELVAEEVNDIVLLEGGSHFATYAWATFRYDTLLDQVIDVRYGKEINEGGMLDAGIDAIVQKWADEASTELDRVIGYTDHLIEQKGSEMRDLATEPVVAAFADVDLYITNSGGLRAPIQPGEITVGDLVSVMPFDNTLIRVELTGAELEEVVAQGAGPVIGGGWVFDGTVYLDATQSPVGPAQTYGVMVNSFMYQGGDNYGAVANYDPNGVDTGINSREPVIDWIEAQMSSASDPLQI